MASTEPGEAFHWSLALKGAKIRGAASRKIVLSIDGGGARGFACLVMLSHLMEILNRNGGHNHDAGHALLPCDIFDLICGTSTGGLIAILLGRLGLDCDTAISVYKELVPSLFGESANEAMGRKAANGNHNAYSNVFEEKLAIIVERFTGAKDTLLKFSKVNTDKVIHKTTDVRSTPFIFVSCIAHSDVHRYLSRLFTLQLHPV